MTRGYICSTMRLTKIKGMIDTVRTLTESPPSLVVGVGAEVGNVTGTIFQQTPNSKKEEMREVKAGRQSCTVLTEAYFLVFPDAQVDPIFAQGMEAEAMCTGPDLFQTWL